VANTAIVVHVNVVEAIYFVANGACDWIC
jgi:hypothetical protein